MYIFQGLFAGLISNGWLYWHVIILHSFILLTSGESRVILVSGNLWLVFKLKTYSMCSNRVYMLNNSVIELFLYSFKQMKETNCGLWNFDPKDLKKTLFKIAYLSVFMCVCDFVCVYMFMPVSQYACGGWRTTCSIQFSTSTVFYHARDRTQPPRLLNKNLHHWAISSSHGFFYK